MKRITMGGTDVVVTDGSVADLVLEYAKELGRIGQTDTVTIPAVLQGAAAEASMLLGPASQIVLTPDLAEADSVVELPGLDRVRSDLQARIDRVSGRGHGTGSAPDNEQIFIDFDEYDLGTE